MAEDINGPWQTVERLALPNGRVTLTVDGKIVFDGYPDPSPRVEWVHNGPLDIRSMLQSNVQEDYRNLSVSHKPTEKS